MRYRKQLEKLGSLDSDDLQGPLDADKFLAKYYPQYDVCALAKNFNYLVTIAMWNDNIDKEFGCEVEMSSDESTKLKSQLDDLLK